MHNMHGCVRKSECSCNFCTAGHAFLHDRTLLTQKLCTAGHAASKVGHVSPSFHHRSWERNYGQLDIIQNFLLEIIF